VGEGSGVAVAVGFGVSVGLIVGVGLGSVAVAAGAAPVSVGLRDGVAGEEQDTLNQGRKKHKIATRAPIEAALLTLVRKPEGMRGGAGLLCGAAFCLARGWPQFSQNCEAASFFVPQLVQ